MIVRSLAVVAAVIGGFAGAADAGTVRGTVFVDQDGDGIMSSDETIVPGAVVAWETDLFTRTDPLGRFEIVAPGSGIVWVRVPDGFSPGPVWRLVDNRREIEIDLPLRPLTEAERTAPLTFVVASDSHMTPGDKPWGRAEFASAVEQATALDPAPRFFTIVGDVTQANRPEEFDDVERVLGDLSTPWIPVSGNHDWYDGGAAWRARFGPDSFSFDIGTVHFVVWNAQSSDADIEAFLGNDLALVDPAMTIVAMGHAAPAAPVIATMRSLGIDYLLTGHWHANRVVDHGGGMIELNTETFVMGGIDYTPAGYRVVTIEGGKLTAYHRSVVDEPYLRVVAPLGDGCASPASFDVIAAAEIDASRLDVTASIDCGPEVPLASAGGWAYRRAMTGIAPGPHTLTLRARGVLDTARVDVSIEVCEKPASGPRQGGDWPQLQGGPEHRGAQATAIEPPVEVVWTTTVGGKIHQGAPVVVSGLVYVSVTDFGGGDTGGVVALELATGAERWRHTTPRTVRNAPAVGNGIVVVGLVDGEIRFLDAATGALRWTYQLGEGLDSRVSALFAPPTIADGVAYVGVQRRFSALSLTEPFGELWSRDPTPGGYWHGSFVAPTVTGGLVVGNFARAESGVVAFDEGDGSEVWRLTGAASYAQGGAVVSDGVVAYIANGQAEVGAFDLGTRTPIWTRVLVPGGFDWGFSTPGTPALADGRLFVATQYKDMVALDAATGNELWRFSAGPSPLHTTHYRGAQQPGFQGSPLVTGHVVWIGGSDGRLSALEAATGAELGHLDVGAPILSGLAAAGDYLIVPSYDGTVRAIAMPVAPAEPPPDPPVVCPPDPEMDEDNGGCCGTTRRPTGDAVLVLLAALFAWRRPRRRA